MLAAGNLFADLPRDKNAEQIIELIGTPEVRIERIVSRGHASPDGFWYDQAQDEWLIVLAGSAELMIEGEAAARHLEPGDYIHIPAHARHRVARTDPAGATVWLAVHFRGA